MSQEYKEVIVESEEITLKDLVLKVKDYWNAVIKNIWIVLLVTLGQYFWVIYCDLYKPILFPHYAVFFLEYVFGVHLELFRPHLKANQII